MPMMTAGMAVKAMIEFDEEGVERELGC